MVLLFLKADISAAPYNDLFITGRGCGIETPIKYLNYFPSTLNEFECSFIQINQTKSHTSNPNNKFSNPSVSADAFSQKLYHQF